MNLRAMAVVKIFASLKLQDDLRIINKIGIASLLQFLALILDFELGLMDGGDAAPPEFLLNALMIDRLHEARAHLPIDLEERSHNDIGFLLED